MFEFSEGLVAFQADGKWGYINAKGETVVAPIHNDPSPFQDGFALVKTDDPMVDETIDPHASGSTTFNHDERNRMAGQISPPGWGSLAYTNYPTGQVNTVQSSNTNGNNLTYGLDTLNRPATVLDGVNTLSLSYDSVGNSASVAMPNSVTVVYGVDTLNRVNGVTWVGGSGTLASYTYTLGAAGNKIGVTESGGREVSWGYDDLYRLTMEQVTSPNIPDPTGSVTYSYDPVGNRQQRNSSVSGVSTQNFSGGYNPADELKPTFSFDGNGNQLSDSQGRTYTWNALNQLIHVTGTGLDVSYVYDGDGLRVQKTNNLTAVTTRYLWDRNNLTDYPQVSEELVNGQVVRRYVYGSNGPLYQVQNTGVSWVTNYFVADATGNIRLVLDDSGQITDALDFDGFGNILRRMGTTDLGVGYQGQCRDNDTGLIYLRARWYNPDLGRFMEMDTYEGDQQDPLSLNKYIFGKSNGVDNSDPSGLQADVASLGIETAMGSILSVEPHVTAPGVAFGTGGPDITQWLNGNISKVDQAFKSWKYPEKKSAMTEMRDYVGGGARGAWDIKDLELVGFGPKTGKNDINGYVCGVDNWKYTVGFNGKCFYAGQANYILWGRMNKLANAFLNGPAAPAANASGLNASSYSLSTALFEVDLWKAVSYPFGSSVYTTEAEQFTTYGYNGTPPSASLACHPSGQKVPASYNFNWCWEPTHPRSW
jgi:RHS repeat-associated protein